MIRILLLLLLLTTPSLAGPNYYNYRINRVLDGDTVEVVVPYLPSELNNRLRIRIYGVDTAEKGAMAKCDVEKSKSETAKTFTEQAIKSAKTKQVRIMKWDKYGGRVLGDIVLDGKSLRMMLLETGNAVEYYGGKKKSWCQ